MDITDYFAPLSSITALISSLSALFSAIFAYMIIKTSVKNHNISVEKSSINNKFSIGAAKRNARISVIMHCNTRYADLYKLRMEIENSDPSKTKNEMIKAYFRQYWGLKSDQIDYWLAGYVDPETLISWFISTVDAIVDRKSVGPTSYEESWNQIEKENEYVNPTMTRIINCIISTLKSDSSPIQRLGTIHCIFESTEYREQKIIEMLSSDHMTFLNLYDVCSDEIQTEIRRIREAITV